MRNRVISFVVCLVMCLTALTVFAGCDTGNVPQVVASDAMAQTLVLAMVRDERTTDAAVKNVENALNEITKTEFNTNIVLKTFTPDEYAGKILTMSKSLYDKQDAYEAKLSGGSAYSDGDTNADTRKYTLDENVEYMSVANGDLMYYDENGRLVTLYPTVDEDQIDVIFVNSLQLYYELVRGKYVIPLSNTLTTEDSKAKKASMIINTTLNATATLTGDGIDSDNRNTYAIPNNYVAPGERYIVVNKKLYDHYQFSTECNIYDLPGGDSTKCDDLADFIEFLEDVAKNNGKFKSEGSDLGVDKILYNLADLGWYNYFAGGGNTNSAIMTHAGVFDYPQVNTYEKYKGVVSPEPVFSQSYFRMVAELVDDLTNRYGSAPYIGDCFFSGTKEEIGFAAPAAKMADNEETFALAMVSGDSSVCDYYDKDDYYVVKIGSSVIDSRMYDSMFAVSTFSTTALDADGLYLRTKLADYEDQENPRAYEIIYAMQTDRRIVNLLTYGVEGYNYDIYENENNNLVHNAGKNDYYPIVGKAGNLFLTYPNDKMTSEELYYSANNWKLAKLQKSVVSPYCGIPVEEQAEDGADYTAAELAAFFTEFYDSRIESILKFNGKGKDGAPCTIGEYLTALSNELKATDQYKCFADCTVEKGYTLSPQSLVACYYLLFRQDLASYDVPEFIDELKNPQI